MGMGSDAYAEAVGSFDIALDAVIRARAAAAGALKENRSREDAEIHAHEAALEVFNEARKNNQIFLNNGTRSATIVRAYMLSGNGL